MDVIDKNSDRWSRHLFCAGGVHTDFGCGSMLAVEVSDLFYVYKYKHRHPELLVAFQCPLCGLGTVVAREGSKEWTKWFDNLHRSNPLQDDDPQGAEAMKDLHLAFMAFVQWCKNRAGRDDLKKLLKKKS